MVYEPSEAVTAEILVPWTFTDAPAIGAAVSASVTKPVTLCVTAGAGLLLPPPPPQPASKIIVAAPDKARGANKRRDMDNALPFSCVSPAFSAELRHMPEFTTAADRQIAA